MAGIKGEGRVVLEFPVEGGAEMAAGVDVAEEDFSNGEAAFLAQIPGLENGGGAGFPGAHAHARAAVVDDDGVAIEPRGGLDQVLLKHGQIERTIAAFAFHVAIQADTNDDGIGVLGRREIGNLRRDEGHSYPVVRRRNRRVRRDRRRDRRGRPGRWPGRALVC